MSMHMYVWSRKPFFIAIAQAESAAKARKLALAQVVPELGGQHLAAYAFISSNTPEIWHGPNAEFELTDSALVIELEEACQAKDKQIAELKAALGKAI